ncbi:outer membrane-stress sensor serine endopeptidase DegS [Gallaecimonas kandeliae]|uniref:outer membrane-stress sensor serine endopeptidase DegS n=1 Tax=Gallaecimonas kandeliae TaxID=3029055 RepID=UPI0026473928|nr:outer membrane-stress sensor serine endopeptidase DegS [Gallaecimonas kandeliae]WKE66060.1 outer membrane-stress sensor serine endopeptidase DegS [Gallaecimonas kandeliae]
MARLFKDLGKAILLGLILAAVLLTFFPSLRKGSDDSQGLFRKENNYAPLLSFSSAVRRAAPAVVNIYSVSNVGKDLYEQRGTIKGLGSGVIMTAKGHILTNFHVIHDADQIVVALQDGRVSYAELVGTDPLTDLAVLQVDLDNLPVIPQDPHNQAQVGDVVLAIGNPYNIGQTITQGIISATGRSGMSSTGYQDFLQTDAAINAGNSGGALVNSNGVLVGINTALFHVSERMDAPGISFAIPYTLAAKILKELVENGRVIRGYFGVNYQQPRVPIMTQPPLITAVDKDSPAEKGGIKVGDLIVGIDGKPIRNGLEAMDLVAETKPGTQIEVTVVRDGKQLKLKVTVGERPPGY